MLNAQMPAVSVPWWLLRARSVEMLRPKLPFPGRASWQDNLAWKGWDWTIRKRALGKGQETGSLILILHIVWPWTNAFSGWVCFPSGQWCDWTHWLISKALPVLTPYIHSRAKETTDIVRERHPVVDQAPTVSSLPGYEHMSPETVTWRRWGWQEDGQVIPISLPTLQPPRLVFLQCFQYIHKWSHSQRSFIQVGK